jgi:replicative DNA helicase
MPKRLLRSIIEYDKEVSSENLVRNFQRLRKAVDVSQLDWGLPTDEKLYKYALGFFLQHFEMPSAQTCLDYFTSVNNVEVVERIKDIQNERPYARTNFVHLLRNLQEDQAKLKAINLLKETHEILIKGVEDKKSGEIRKGLEEAILHFTKRAQEIRVDDSNVQIHGDIRQDGERMKEEYTIAENDKGRVFGVLSGINEIDDSCKGAKKGELWMHAAFPGELKTTLAINWCYSAVTRFKKNVVYVSFEMPREQIRRNVYTLHSSNTRFTNAGLPPVDYRHIRDGNLTKAEREFYFDHVIPDFGSNPTYGTFEVVTPDREWTMADVRSEIELLHKEFEVGLVILDHGQWIEARKSKKSKEYTIELNSVIADAKRLALNFDHNSGIPVLMLFQINRTGKTEADKNEGVYKMNALTYANNAEKTADVITTTYWNNDMRRSGLTKFTNLKNRDNQPFEPFTAHVNMTCRRILSEKRMAPQGFAVEAHSSYMDTMEQV